MKSVNHFFVFPIVFFVALVLIQGCNSTSEPAKTETPIVTDQDASGLYTGTGTGTFTGVNTDNEVMLSTVKGLVDGTRFIFFNADTSNADFNVLYDGQITSITLTALVGTASVYQGGNLVSANVSVTGTVNSVSRVQLTLATKGNFLGGTVDGLFIKPTTIYDRVATNDRILSDGSQVKNNEFTGNITMVIPSMATTNFQVFNNNNYRLISIKTGARCDHRGTVTTVGNKNIYPLAEFIILKTGCTLPTTGYTGFASVLDGNLIDDVLWYAVTNSTNSIFAVLPRLP